MRGWDTFLEIWNTYDLTERTFEHLRLFGIALGLTVFLGLTIGILISYYRKSAKLILNFINGIQTIPTLALLVILIPVAGLGLWPTVIASVLYSLQPIIRNTYTGLTNIDNAIIDVAKATGLTKRDIYLKIRFPLAFPLIISGIRVATVFIMGVVTLGGLISAGGLGASLQTGIHFYSTPLILIAGLWTGVMAALLDGIMIIIEQVLKRWFPLW
jgi:osmoprotectant transport system permease protein